MKCAFPTASGETCEKYAAKNSEFCVAHRDLVATMKAEAQEILAQDAAEAEVREQDLTDEAEPAEVDDQAEADDAVLRANADAIVDTFRKGRSETTARRVPARERAPRPEPTDAESDPVQRAQLLVQVHLAREAERKFRRGSGARDRDGFRTRDGEDKAEPWQVIPRIREIDETTPVDPVTGEYPKDIKPGWVTHWVSMRDSYDRPTTASLAKRQRYGYVVVRDSEGEPLEGRLGTLMQAPPEASAAYTLAGMPQGAMKRDEALAQAADMNAEIGERFGGIVVEQEHVHKRGTVAGAHHEFPE